MRYFALALVVIGVAILIALRKREKVRRNYAIAGLAGLIFAAGYAILMVLNDESVFRIIFPFLSGPVFGLVVFDRIGRPTREQQEREQRIATQLRGRVAPRLLNLLASAILVGTVAAAGLGFLVQYRWDELSSPARWATGTALALSIALAVGAILYLWIQRRKAQQDSEHD